MSIAEKLQTIAENEQKVYEAGYEKGKSEADTETAYNEGVEAGKQAEYNETWDTLQCKGERTIYTGFFAHLGTEKGVYLSDIKPKYVIKPAYANYMFYHYPEEMDLTQFLNENEDISIDLTALKEANNSFAYSKFSRVPALSVGVVTQTFQNATKLKTIDKLTVTSTAKTCAVSAFQNCSALENITFGGAINGNGLNFQWATKLTHDSLSSIINALADKSADTSGTQWVVTVGSTNIAKLTTEDLENIAAKGWNFK